MIDPPWALEYSQGRFSRRDSGTFQFRKKLEIFGGHLLSEDDHSHWAPQYWNITNFNNSDSYSC